MCVIRTRERSEIYFLGRSVVYDLIQVGVSSCDRIGQSIGGISRPIDL
jgi:hypothetical protein